MRLEEKQGSIDTITDMVERDPVPRHQVGVDDGNTILLEHAADRGLTRGHTPSQAHQEHGDHLLHLFLLLSGPGCGT